MKVLIAEDDVDFRFLLTETLSRWGHKVIAVSNGRDAWQVLQKEDAPTLAIMDWVMPEMDGIEVCRRVRQQADKPYCYLVLLTARGGKEEMLEGLEAGADDYLAKPIDVHELRARLSTGQRILALQDQLLTSQRSLREQATHDALTGLWNRAVILETLDRELARRKRRGASLGVIMADLDHFKHINDTQGHPAGDIVLREAAQRMLAALRPYDTIGRYGGEEFLIVLPDCDATRTVSLGERLRRGIADVPFVVEEGIISVTMSLGATAVESLEKADASDVLHLADAALYRAKKQGRNRVESGFARSTS